MAIFLTPLNANNHSMQAGERRLAQRLEQLLDDDYLCWYEVPTGKGGRQRYSDFIIAHPLRGVLLLEVKDWKRETLHKVDKKSFTLITSSGLKTVANPLEQVRQCAYKLVKQLEQDPQLIEMAGRYQGKLAFPYGYGVVFTNLSRSQFEETDLGEVIPSARTLCKDEMLETTDSEDFQQSLWAMFDYQFQQKLSESQLDRIRWHIFPEIRITQGQLALDAVSNSPIDRPFISENSLDSSNDHLIVIPDTMLVMDYQQEQLARSLGAGHRVIHGVAGSGKTLILGFRCEQLASIVAKPILVLCYNIALAARLRLVINSKGLTGKVRVHHFHEWCSEVLIEHKLPKPIAQDDIETYLNLLEQSVIDAVAQGAIPLGIYGAVLIDEGHDFKPEWLRLLTQCVDASSDSLLLLYDDAQSIYNAKGNLSFSLSSVGIKAQGRTTILSKNYRNPQSISEFAKQFAQQFCPARYLNKPDNDQVPQVTAESIGKLGVVPQVRLFDSFQSEVNTITRWLQNAHNKHGWSWTSFCVLYRFYSQGKQLQKALERANIPHQWLGSAAQKRQFNTDDNSVKLMTFHSSKGLEFPWVVVAGLGYVMPEEDDIRAEAKLLYVAMTRATEQLWLTAHQSTDFVDYLQGQDAEAI